MIQDCTQGALSEVRAFADEVGLRDQLEKKLQYLEEYAPGIICKLYPDFAPNSFFFVLGRETERGVWNVCLNGGLIFHGLYDRGGDGGAPTFSTCMTPTSGWAIHT